MKHIYVIKYINTINNKKLLLTLYTNITYIILTCIISKYLLFEVDLLSVYIIDSRINIIYYKFTLFS